MSPFEHAKAIFGNRRKGFAHKAVASGAYYVLFEHQDYPGAVCFGVRRVSKWSQSKPGVRCRALEFDLVAHVVIRPDNSMEVVTDDKWSRSGFADFLTAITKGWWAKYDYCAKRLRYKRRLLSRANDSPPFAKGVVLYFDDSGAYTGCSSPLPDTVLALPGRKVSDAFANPTARNLVARTNMLLRSGALQHISDIRLPPGTPPGWSWHYMSREDRLLRYMTDPNSDDPDEMMWWVAVTIALSDHRYDRAERKYVPNTAPAAAKLRNIFHAMKGTFIEKKFVFTGYRKLKYID